METTTPVRRLFHAGKITHRKDPKPCANGWHEGPMLKTAEYDAAGWIWPGVADCATCGGTVARTDFRRMA